jgi:2-amino-4-hydroxy-6-hydroxymethyldihydropteridine diphosphokinase
MSERRNNITIALGANIHGSYGDPLTTLRRCVELLSASGVQPIGVSGIFSTLAKGGGRQPRYLNTVVKVYCTHTPAQLLRLFKKIERSAGRRRLRGNGPRPLDIDIIDFKRRIIGWPNRVVLTAEQPPHRRNWLVLPHPEAHRRRFVLEPLLEVAPHWRHPALQQSGWRLLKRIPHRPGEQRRVLDSGWLSCDTLNR